MRRRMEYRPSRSSSAFGLVVGLLFVLLGLFVIIPQFGAFGLIWTLISLGITIVNAVNTFSDKGVASGVIHIEDEEEAPAPSPPPAAAQPPLNPRNPPKSAWKRSAACTSRG